MSRFGELQPGDSEDQPDPQRPGYKAYRKTLLGLSADLISLAQEEGKDLHTETLLDKVFDEKRRRQGKESKSGEEEAGLQEESSDIRARLHAIINDAVENIGQAPSIHELLAHIKSNADKFGGMQSKVFRGAVFDLINSIIAIWEDDPTNKRAIKRIRKDNLYLTDNFDLGRETVSVYITTQLLKEYQLEPLE